MKKFPMDLSKFKKVGADEHMTMLRHDDGHEIKIAHSALSKGIRSQLEKIPHYADGGSVPDYLKPNQSYGSQPDFISNAFSVPKDQAPASSPDDEFKRRLEEESLRRTVNSRSGFAPDPAALEPGVLRGMIRDQSQASMAAQGHDQQLADQSALRSRAGVSPSPTPSQIASNDQVPATAVPGLGEGQFSREVGAAPTPGLTGNLGDGGQYGTLMSGMNQALQGFQQQAQAETQLGQAKAKAYDEHAQKLQGIQDSYNQKYTELDQMVQHTAQDYASGHIDPNRYWSNLGTGGKIGTVMGLILGGIGSGMTGQPSIASQMLNHALDRDMEAQRAEMDKGKNLLSINMQRMGNLRDAMSMTRAMQMDAVSAQIDAQAAKVADPMAKARMLQQSGELKMKIAPELQQLAMRQTMMQVMNGGGGTNPENMLGYLRVMNPQAAKEMESRYVPGVGFSQIPIGEKARGEITGRKELGEIMERLDSFSKKHSGTVLDRNVVHEGEALARLAQDSFRRAMNEGVFKEGEAKFINSIIGDDPTQFLASIRSQPGYRIVRESNQSALNGLYKQHGVQVPQFKAAPLKIKGQ